MRTSTKEIAKLIVFSAEATRRSIVFEAAHTSNATLDTAVVLFEPVVQVGIRPGLWLNFDEVQAPYLLVSKGIGDTARGSDPAALIPPGVVLEGVDEAGTVMVITVRSPAAGVDCPDCGGQSHRVHSRYTRTLADLPLQVEAGQNARCMAAETSTCSRPVSSPPVDERHQNCVRANFGRRLPPKGGQFSTLIHKQGLLGRNRPLGRNAFSAPLLPDPRIHHVDNGAISFAPLPGHSIWKVAREPRCRYLTFLG